MSYTDVEDAVQIFAQLNEKSETETDILKSVIETLPGKFEAENGLTFENELEFEMNPVEICRQRLDEWVSESKLDLKSVKRPFNDIMIESVLLDDFDLTSDDVSYLIIPPS